MAATNYVTYMDEDGGVTASRCSGQWYQRGAGNSPFRANWLRGKGDNTVRSLKAGRIIHVESMAHALA
jgi:hypothetical protein